MKKGEEGLKSGSSKGGIIEPEKGEGKRSREKGHGGEKE